MPGNTETPQALQEHITYHLKKRNPDSALMLIERQFTLLNTDTLSHAWGMTLTDQGFAYHMQGRYELAGKSLFQALGIGEKTNDKKLQMEAYNNLGILFFSLRNTEESVSNYHRLYDIATQEKDSVYMVKALNNIGNAYTTIDQNTEKAIPYFQECIRIAECINFKAAVSNAMIILAQIYNERGNHDLALKTIRQVEAKGGMDTYGIYTLAEIHRDKGEYDEAILLFESLIHRKLNSKEFYLAILKELYGANENKGDLKEALYYLNRYQAAKDSIHTIETERSIHDLKIAYDIEKKEIRIANMEEERQLMLILGISGIVILILMLLSLLFRHRWIRKKKELAEQHILQLEKEKLLIAAESLLKGEHHERIRLSRELHDSLGGLLTMVKLNLSRIKDEHKEIATELDPTILLMDRSIQEMRHLAHSLMPESLNRFGLKPVLEEFTQGSKLIHFYFFGEEKRLSEKIEINIYRIACELINNALKHANASEINVQLLISGTSISLTVQDNGIGFDSQNIKNGLATVRSRTELLGATLNIYSQPNKGTEIMVEIIQNKKSDHP